MKKLLLMSLLVLIGGTVALQAKGKATKKTYAIGFYNLENLFDTIHDEGHNDYEYLPTGKARWTSVKYENKLRNMSRVLAEMATDRLPQGCAAIGVAEVENARCLTDLCQQPALRARNMQFVHIEGPDQRGIDCALLYNPKLFKVRNVKLVPYIYKLPQDSMRATRGFLTVSGTMGGEHVTIVVNHLPSRFAGSYYREEGGRQLRAVVDSLVADDPQVKLFVMGDMNDDPHNLSMSQALGARREMSEVEQGGLYNPWWNIHASGTGTLMYRGQWNLFDQIILSASLLPAAAPAKKKTLRFTEAQIFRRDYLIQQSGPYKGSTLRTSAGGLWLNGYSDHLPTLVYLRKE